MRYTCASILAACLLPGLASGFCGTYVGGPGQTIRNQGSQIVVARYGDRTTLTMFNDFQGDPTDFALVIPMPSSIDGNNVRTIDGDFMGRLDAYSTPREVAFTCHDFYSGNESAGLFSRSTGSGQDARDSGDTGLSGAPATGSVATTSGGCGGGGTSFTTTDDVYVPPETWIDEEHGVKVEDHFNFGEYEAFVLSAEEGQGLLGWLDENGFVLQDDAAALLDEYLEGTFLAVRIEADQVASGDWLSPIQVDYSSPMVSLPIRLGAVSSTGVQDMTLFTLSTKGRGEITNYPKVEVPNECMRTSDLSLGEFYEEAFRRAVGVTSNPYDRQTGAGWVFEYGWYTPQGQQTAKCDPCAEGSAGVVMPNPSQQPLSAEDIGVLGLPEGLAEGFYTSRMHMRYTPDAVKVDLSVVTDSGIFDNFQLLWVQHAHELESVLDSCGEPFEDPGSCYSSEYFLDRAEDRAEGRPVQAMSSPRYCGGRGRAALILGLPLGLAMLRRRR